MAGSLFKISIILAQILTGGILTISIIKDIQFTKHKIRYMYTKAHSTSKTSTHTSK